MRTANGIVVALANGARIAAIALVTESLLAIPASSQSVVRGVVVDSTRGGRPLAGAAVVVAGDSRQARTDSLGRFSVTLRAGGEARLLVASPFLDSLGIEQFAHELGTPLPSSEISISTPTMGEIQRHHCGVVFPAERTVIVGKLRRPNGEVVAGLAVWASWREISLEGQSVLAEQMATVDTTDSDGWFALCGVPRNESSSIRTEARDAGIGTFRMSVTEPVQRHDLVIGPRDDLMTVRGLIRIPVSGAASTVAVGAQVRLLDDSSVAARTDANGAFSLRIPRRSSMLEIRRIGIEPQLFAVPIETVEDSPWEIELAPAPVKLAPTEVVSERYARDFEEFEQRRLAGVGRFITEATIREYPILTPSVIRSIVPSVAAAGSGRYVQLKIRSFNQYCDPKFFEDGIRVGVMHAVDQAALLQRAKRIEIYTATQAPPRFSDSAGCGAVVVWTR